MQLSYIWIVAWVLHEFFIYCTTAEVLWELFRDLCKPNVGRCSELMSKMYLQWYKCFFCAVEGSAQRWIELDWRLHCGATPAKMKAVGSFCVCAAQSLKCAGACLHILWTRWYSQSFCRYRGQWWHHRVKGLRRDINNKCKRLTYLQMNRPVQDLFDDRESLVVTRWARACHVYKGSGSFVSCQTDVRTKIKNSPKKLLFVVLFDQWEGELNELKRGNRT